MAMRPANCHPALSWHRPPPRRPWLGPALLCAVPALWLLMVLS